MNNTPFDQLIALFSQQGLLTVTKTALVVSFLIYFVFTIVVVAQIKRMFETISTGAESLIYLTSLVHLGLSLLALIWAIVIL